MHKKKITIVCGGPSAERGISLNSARSLYDNLDKEKYELSLIYFNPRLNAYRISEAQIYSNTPLDFDYRLSNQGKSLTKEELRTELKKTDLIFPAIHGFFGEDGQLQTLLEEFGVRYVGSGPKACQNTSDKHLCQKILRNHNLFTIQDWVYKKDEALPELPAGKYVIKPLHGGSSLGVQYFEMPIQNPETLKKQLELVFAHEEEAIIEPFFEGTEFTLIVLENGAGEPVALLPTEIEFHSEGDRFFNYRKKYLATAETRYHTPARFSPEVMAQIRSEGERLFTVLGMRDFARMDGWIKENGTIWFSDINAISGMEQNSFLFQQAALFGISHRQLLDYIIEKRIEAPSAQEEGREEIPVIFGGDTAERQVSVMSGTNVWMKLKSSKKYKPVPLFLSTEQKIYHVPQFLCLHHTVEEMEEKVNIFQKSGFMENLKKEEKPILERLGIHAEDLEEKIFTPVETDLQEIAQNYAFLFLGLHGGDGENGVIQTKLDELGLPYNGPGPEASALCMDKFETGQKIAEANLPGIKTARKKMIQLGHDANKIWNELLQEEFHPPLILKPRGDGCSAGVVRVDTPEQFTKALHYFSGQYPHIPEKAIHDEHGQIDLPNKKVDEILVEEFIETDHVVLKDLEIDWKESSDIIEVTVGVLGERGAMKAMNPSQTIASQKILSLEEKFMGGTGINLTPPPEKFVKSEVVRGVQKHVENVANILGLEGYSRIDTFMNIGTGDITVIEANTLPGLTPSTVLYHQALAEPTPMIPRQLLEKIIEIGKNRFQKKESADRNTPNNSENA